MIIALSGTPGCGKTAATKILKARWLCIDLNKIIKEKKLCSGYDKKRKTYIANIKKVESFVRRFARKQRKNIIVDSHLSHLLSPTLIDITIILRCEPLLLAKRLKKKKWSEKKIKENCEAELIGVISFEAKQKKHNIYEIDTTKLTPLQTAKIIKEIIKYQNNKYKKQIDWLAKL